MKKHFFIFIITFLILSACTSPTTGSNPNPDSSQSPTTSVSDSLFGTPSSNPAESASTSNCHKIAFALFNYQKQEPPDIYTICPDGSHITRLTNNSTADETPVWSPDGKRLAFVSNRSGSYQVYLMDADGGHVTQVTTDYDNSLPKWLPDGLHIAFRTTDNQGLWWWRTAKLDGSDIKTISEQSYDFFYQTPAWSPDGKKNAYMSLEEQKARNDGSSQIHVKDINGANDVALTHDTWENATPIWSPNGKNIAFLSEMHGEPNIFALYVMRADGTGVKQLSKAIYTDVSASFSWSPDGKQIAIGDVNIGHINIITVASGDIQELLYLKEGEAIYAPSWQP